MIPAKIDDFVWNEVKNAFYDGVQALPYKEPSKRVYLFWARKMIEYCRYEGKDSDALISRVGLTVQILSKYFGCLERRCLKKCSLEACRDLIGIRLLFYVPLETIALEKITIENIDTLKNRINIDDRLAFPVPATFVELAVLYHCFCKFTF